MTIPTLRDLIDRHFNNDELRQLCLDLSIEYENLPGDTRITRAQALIQYCLRHNRLPDLGGRCRELRPAPDWPNTNALAEEWQKIQQTQDNLSTLLSGEPLEVALASLRQKETELLVQLIGSDVAAWGENATAVGERGVMAEGNVGGDITTGQKIVVTAEKGATVVIGNDAPVQMPAVDKASALGRYLQRIIARNRYLQLQGIRSGGRLVNIELEHIYITLRATQKRTVQAEESWLAHERTLAPGENHERFGGHETVTETITVSVNEALSSHNRLVVLGDPGSGKTTLLRYLALIYANDLAQKSGSVADKLGLAEVGFLPILLPLRQIGTFLGAHPDDGTEGHALLLEFLRRYLENERVTLPDDFFDDYLAKGRAVILLDGMDEVASSDIRRRVSRLIEAFTRAYPRCRIVVTSRIVGYTGAARLGEGYTTSTVRDFTLKDVKQFLTYWHQLVAVGQMGQGKDAAVYAAKQTSQLMDAIANNERIRELAINPLMLTVIALVHRDRVKLPDRRAELYAEAVDVLLGKWDEARGVAEPLILQDKPFDIGDRRLMLQSVALHMHERQQKEIETDELRRLLFARFNDAVRDNREAERAVSRFLRVVEERTGLLVARGGGVYAFSHLTFQEYLTALAIIAKVDPVSYVLAHSDDSWWQEAILLAAGQLSMTSKERTTEMITAIANKEDEPELYHNLVLAARCLHDVGNGRVKGNLEEEIQQRLQSDMAFDLNAEIKQRKPQSGWEKFWRNARGDSFDERAFRHEWVQRKVAAITALGRLSGYGQERFWTRPYGEPEWVEIPAGPFTMGEGAARQVNVPAFAIARAPISNAQYLLFVEAAGHDAPRHWEENRIPKGLESHPVVYVSWYDAIAYCQWLSQATGQDIALPSEAEWKKAARGDKDTRQYPWGDTFDRLRCNTSELGIGGTTPVGIFPDGASPYGVLDMSGNVWEWQRNKYDNPEDDQIDESGARRVLRGGSWRDLANLARAAFRSLFDPDSRFDFVGFRVAVRRPPSHLGL